MRIVLAEYQADFTFEPEACIAVEGQWEVRNRSGQAESVDVLRGRRVTGAKVKPPRSFVPEFDGGYLLEIFDSSEQYESFSIQPGDIFV